MNQILPPESIFWHGNTGDFNDLLIKKPDYIFSSSSSYCFFGGHFHLYPILNLIDSCSYPLEDILILTLTRDPVAQLKSYLNWIFKQSIFVQAPHPLSNSISIKNNSITASEIVPNQELLREICNLQTQYLLDIFISPSLDPADLHTLLNKRIEIRNTSCVKIFNHHDVGKAFKCIKAFLNSYSDYCPQVINKTSKVRGTLDFEHFDPYPFIFSDLYLRDKLGPSD